MEAQQRLQEEGCVVDIRSIGIHTRYLLRQGGDRHILRRRGGPGATIVAASSHKDGNNGRGVLVINGPDDGAIPVLPCSNATLATSDHPKGGLAIRTALPCLAGGGDASLLR